MTNARRTVKGFWNAKAERADSGEKRPEGRAMCYVERLRRTCRDAFSGKRNDGSGAGEVVQMRIALTACLPSIVRRVHAF